MNSRRRISRCAVVAVSSLLLLGWNGLGVVVVAEPSLAGAVAETKALIRQEIVPKTPGLSVSVARDGKIIWSEGFGFANLEQQKPVTTQTLFRVGSISKSLTAAGLMLLVEKGKLDLDADIRRYLPDFPDKGHLITTRQLAGHLAGIRHYKSNEFLLDKPFASVADSLKIFENDPLLSTPGEQYFYSTFGWVLISRVMEVAAREDFLPYMQKSVFAPLGLTNTMPDYADREVPQRTQFYDVKPGGGFVPSPVVDCSDKWAGGGFLSTPEDLVHFGAALLHSGFLQRESLRTMFISQKTTAGKVTGYGVGWFVTADAQGHPVFWHTGGSVGGTSVLLLHPQSRLVLAMCSNCTTVPFKKENWEAVAEIFSAFVPMATN